MTPDEVALFTDLYELTMAAGYLNHFPGRTATFELTVRDLPAERRFLVAAGVDEAIDALTSLCFGSEATEALRSLDRFDETFLRHIDGLGFTGDVDAVAEAEIIRPGTPILRVTAPIIEAQIVETLLLAVVGHRTSLASKAARLTVSCGERATWVDFGARRAHGPDAAVAAARCAYLGGAAATSLVLAGHRHGVPVRGTMAHAYVMAFGSEEAAFRTFLADHPDDGVLLIDTYDTAAGAATAALVAGEGGAPERLAAVRIDSGDLGSLAAEVRGVLDAAGCRGTRILVSGDLDEHAVTALVSAGAPIDAFGIGTRYAAVTDAPALEIVYKLVEDDAGPRMKASPGKRSLPGRKQVFRPKAGLEGDRLGLADEIVPAGHRPLLTPTVRGGVRCRAPSSLAAARDRALAGLAALGPTWLGLGPGRDDAGPQPTPALVALAERTALTVAGQVS